MKGAYLYSQLTKLLLTLCDINYLRKKQIYLKQVCTFQSNQTKFETVKSSLPSKRFSVLLLTSLNPRKPKVRWKCISQILLILIFTTTNLLYIYYVNIASYETLEKNNNIIISKPNKGNVVVILDQKLYNKLLKK